MSNSESFSKALFCDNIGATFSDVRCCYINDQTTPTCRRNFNASGDTFKVGCNNGDCISECQKPTILYSSDIQDEASTRNGQAPIQRFRTCVNVPAIFGFARQDSLDEDTTAAVGWHIPRDSPDAALANVTNVVTECLTQTCKASRNPSACSQPCSAVNMLVNSTRPNIGGVNGCLNKLCTGGYASLPYADADVIGIGVCSKLPSRTNCDSAFANQHNRFSRPIFCNAYCLCYSGSVSTTSRAPTGSIRPHSCPTRTKGLLKLSKESNHRKTAHWNQQARQLLTCQRSRPACSSFTSHNATSAPPFRSLLWPMESSLRTCF